MSEPFDFKDDKPPPTKPRSKPEHPFGGDWLYFAAFAVTLVLPIVGILFGLVDMGGRSAARRSKGLGLLLFGLIMAAIYAGALLR